MVNALKEYISLRRKQSHFSNDRSIRNALDRAKLRHANRIFLNSKGLLNASDLSTIEEADILSSRVFSGGIDESP